MTLRGSKMTSQRIKNGPPRGPKWPLRVKNDPSGSKWPLRGSKWPLWGSKMTPQRVQNDPQPIKNGSPTIFGRPYKKFIGPITIFYDSKWYIHFQVQTNLRFKLIKKNGPQGGPPSAPNSRVGAGIRASRIKNNPKTVKNEPKWVQKWSKMVENGHFFDQNVAQKLIREDPKNYRII